MSADGQYLSGTLTTLSDGVNGDEELRSANLVFVFGDEANQLVVGGISLYPPAGSTIAVGAETVRPVVGGSGIYAGRRARLSRPILVTRAGPTCSISEWAKRSYPHLNVCALGQLSSSAGFDA